ncbi:MAG: DUF4179 domain-containing protein [Eubacteriales bacterium]|nr:DUF4179 domain-containing protein [Eubacteriales bacterium]
MNRTLNDKEKLICRQLQENVEIPSIVTDKVQEAYRMIENHKVTQEARPKNPLRWINVTMKAAGCAAAALGLGFIICVTNPVMAKELPLIGGLFEQLQDKVSFFGDFADKATPLSEDSSGTETTGDDASGDGNTSKTPAGEGVYTKSSDGLTVTFSEVYANDQAIYLTMKAESDEPFPETMMYENELGVNRPVISLEYTKDYSFMEDAEDDSYRYGASQPEGVFLDDHTFSCILRIDLAQDTKDTSEYSKKYEELTEQIITSLGLTREEFENLDDFNEDDYAVLEKFNNDISSQSGNLKSYIKQIPVPDDFTLHLEISQFIGDKKEQEIWDSGYTGEELEAMSDEEWRDVMLQEPAEYSEFPNKYNNYWYEGPWSFDIPVTIDTSRTETLELHETNEAGIGLETVIKTPYELTIEELYEEGADSDNIVVALDADGNKLPYNDSNNGINNFAIQDRDISTVDIYILDYMQYMDELKGEERYSNNENKPEEEKWGTLLEKNAKYHKTVQF